MQSVLSLVRKIKRQAAAELQTSSLSVIDSDPAVLLIEHALQLLGVRRENTFGIHQETLGPTNGKVWLFIINL